MNSRLIQLTVALIGLAIAACGPSAPTATSSPTPAQAAACTVAAVMVPIRAKYNNGQTQATVPSNAGLVCDSGIAKIRILISAQEGEQGSGHLVLLEDKSGKWVIANDKLCNSAGQPTRTIPPKLGTVCGVQ
ncbi:MAG: hypothetical protein M3R21_05675 [Candidatus Dormibacteraeota bacterium]|nr:hypothetical protein [Candidatus Dormibacteraeota bacterium]